MPSFPFRFFLPLLGFIALALPLQAQDDVHVPLAEDLQSDGKVSKARRSPILLVVSSRYCGYCVRVKRDVIEPMIRSGQYAENTLIRELLIDEGISVLDFSGKRVAGAELAQRYQADITPTLLFLDGEGHELSHRMIGVDTLDFYAYFVDQSLEEARNKLGDR